MSTTNGTKDKSESEVYHAVLVSMAREPARQAVDRYFEKNVSR